MSYSFQFVTQSKADVQSKLAEEFDKVVASQPVHARDRDAAISAALAMVNALGENAERNIEVRVNGSVGWDWPSDGSPADQSTVPLTCASVSVAAYLVERTT